jgi:DNA modification methylase
MGSRVAIMPSSPKSRGRKVPGNEADRLFLPPSNQRVVRNGTFQGVPAYALDVPETIPQLGYGTHQFFRYYGKFPSVVGREIIRKFVPPGARVLDCYAGSGTTLVEAQIHGSSSFGVDINPLAVFAANIKTQLHDLTRLREAMKGLQQDLASSGTTSLPSGPNAARLDKWFTKQAAHDLGLLKSSLMKMEESPERDFLILAFLAIVRRTSNAFDGEVRPHVNSKKKPRPPLRAFFDKFEDMINGAKELASLRASYSPSLSVIGDNRDPSAYSAMAGTPVDLIVAHPPYLNSFNYLQVYSLEFMWSEGFDTVWQGWTPEQIKALEHKAWPATDENLKRQYYEDFGAAMKAAIANLSSGGVAAVVVGDATIRGELEPVHRIFWRFLSDFLDPIEIWFRTTHYGIGKYAYRDRADYHGAVERKRDVIMFFRG